MDVSLITLGANAPDAALTLNRVALGVFFAISGYHKLFNASRHATLTRTLQDAGVRGVPVMKWLVPGVEFSAGCALILGLLSALAAFGLFVVCLGALTLERLEADRHMAAGQPRRLGGRCALPPRIVVLHRPGRRDAGRPRRLEH